MSYPCETINLIFTYMSSLSVILSLNRVTECLNLFKRVSSPGTPSVYSSCLLVPQSYRDRLPGPGPPRTYSNLFTWTLDMFTLDHLDLIAHGALPPPLSIELAEKQVVGFRLKGLRIPKVKMAKNLSLFLN